MLRGWVMMGTPLMHPDIISIMQPKIVSEGLV